MDAQRQEVVSSQKPSNQTGQQNAGNQANVRPLPFAVSDATKASLDKLSPEVRTEVLAAMDDTITTWNRNYSEIRQGEAEELKQGRQAKENMDFLWGEADFQRFMDDKRTGVQNVPNQQQANQSQVGSVDFQKYGDSANNMKDFFSDMGEIMDERLKPAFDRIDQNIAGLQSNFARTQQEKDWSALEQYTTDNKLPDPNDYKAPMMMLLRENPGLALQRAYAACIPLDSFAVRPAVNQQVQQGSPGQQQENQGQPQGVPPGTQTPGANRGSASLSPQTKPQTHQEVLASIIKMRKEGKVPGENYMRDGFQKVVDDVNLRDGTSLTVDDI